MTSKPWILRDWAGGRYFQFRSGIINAFRQELSQILSEKVAVELFYRAGLTGGRDAYRHAKENIRSEDEFWYVLNQLGTATGWGHVLSHESVPGEDTLSVKVTLEDSAFADGISAPNPVCPMLTGMFAGWLSAYHERPVIKAEETACVATNGQKCVFIIQLGRPKG